MHELQTADIYERKVKFWSNINQSDFYSANIPGIARLSGATTKSVFKGKIDEAVPQHQQVIGHAGVYRGKGQVKKICLETSPEGGN